MWIKREIESYLKQSASAWPAVLLTGARQTGKTSLLRHLFGDYDVVSLDLPSEAEQAEHDSRLFLERHPTPLIIDEVQYAPAIMRYLKIAIDADRSRKGLFLLTGSQRFSLMKQVQESLAGRLAIIELEPLSIFEIERSVTGHSITRLMLMGGYPELHLRDAPQPAEFFRSYITSYLERDLKIVLNVSDLRDFERFLRACATRSGNLLNKSDLARDVGISPSTAAAWINALVTSGIVCLLEPWYSNISRSLAKSPKIYFSDTGLLCYLLNIRNEEMLLDSPHRGAVWETLIFSELRKRLLSRRGEWNINFYRDRSQEIDFMIPMGNKFHLIEAKWKEIPNAADASVILKLRETLGPGKIVSGSVVSRTSNRFPIAEGVEAIPFGTMMESLNL